MSCYLLHLYYLCAVVLYVMSLNYSVAVFNFREWSPRYGRGF